MFPGVGLWVHAVSFNRRLDPTVRALLLAFVPALSLWRLGFLPRVASRNRSPLVAVYALLRETFFRAVYRLDKPVPSIRLLAYGR